MLCLKGDEVGERVVEEIVAGDDEEIVVEAGAHLHEADVADRAEPVVVRRRAVVVHEDVLAVGPAVELVGEARVRHEVHAVDLRLVQLVQHPVDHRPSADRQQVLRHGVRERLQPRRVAGGEDQAVQMPSSVTIAAMSAAGVTSNAGFLAGKRVVISAGSRSSIGISAPVGVAASMVDVGATTYSGMP